MQNRLHILGPFDQAGSDGAHEALEIFRQLAEVAEVALWSVGTPDPRYADYPIRRLDGAGDGTRLPAEGTLIFVGVEHQPGMWLGAGRFTRLIVRLGLADGEAAALFRLLGSLREATGLAPDLVFSSARQRQQLALDGMVEPPPLDLRRLPLRAGVATARPFTVGRHSRDSAEQHHADDVSLYRQLVLSGHRVRLLGGTCLAPSLGVDGAGIELLESGAEPVPAFLHGLDVFFYRRSDAGMQAISGSFGRAVCEAMACGLPVLCERRCAPAAWLEDGVNGLLFDTQEQAIDQLLRLAQDEAQRHRLGAAARATMEGLYGEDARRERRGWYMR